MAIIFFITVKANKDWYFNTHLTYLLKLLIDCKLIRGFFDEKYLKVGATPCHMAYSPISSFSVTLHALYLPCFLMLSSFSLNCLATSFSRFIKSNSTADTTSEGFGTCLKYLVVVDVLTSCYSLVVCFNFDHLHQTWRAGRFEYLNTVVKECINEKKRWNHCIAKQFWMCIVAEIYSLQWKWSHLLPDLLVPVVGMFIKSWHGKIQRWWSIKF